MYVYTHTQIYYKINPCALIGTPHILVGILTDDEGSGPKCVGGIKKLYLSLPLSLSLSLYIYIYIYIYTGCNRRNGPDFGRVFLMLYYTDITQNTYIQS